MPTPTDPLILACAVRLERLQAKALAVLATADRALADTDLALRASRAALAERPVRDPDPPPPRRWADEWAAVMATYPAAD